MMAMKKKSQTFRKSFKSTLIDELDPRSNGAKAVQEIASESSDLTHKSGQEQGRRRGGNPPEEYRFKPGQSGNPGGRTPDLVKAIALRLGQLKAGRILSDKEQDKLRKLGLDAADITVVESIIIDWMTSSNPIKQQMYIERIAGKVPNVNINAEVSAAIVSKFRAKLTDAELERIGSGEDALEILLEKLPDIPDIERKTQPDDEDIVDALD